MVGDHICINTGFPKREIWISGQAVVMAWAKTQQHKNGKWKKGWEGLGRGAGFNDTLYIRTVSNDNSKKFLSDS